MKKILFAIAVAAAVMTGCKTQQASEEPEWFTNKAYFEEKNGLYEELPVYPANIVMVGDDYIDRGLWNEFYGDTTIKNRGITYDATPHVLYRIDKIAAQKPHKIFVSVGYNDIVKGSDKKEIVDNIGLIFKRIKKLSPDTKGWWLNIVCTDTLDEAQKDAAGFVNAEVAKLAAKGGFEVIDIDSVLRDGINDGSFSWDGGKYLNGAGYEAFAKALEGLMKRESLVKANDKEYALEVSDYYKHRVSVFRALPDAKAKIVMLGNSLNNNAPWNELFPMGYTINRGISGDVVEGVDQRLDEIVPDVPSKIFLVTATNDFVNDSTIQAIDVWQKYEKLIKDIRAMFPATRLYVQSTLPLNPKSKFYLDNNAKIAELNKLLFGAAERYGYLYLDIATPMSDENGDLREQYTTDGIHLSATGYFVWAAELAKGNRMMLMI